MNKYYFRTFVTIPVVTEVTAENEEEAENLAYKRHCAVMSEDLEKMSTTWVAQEYRIPFDHTDDIEAIDGDEV